MFIGSPVSTYVKTVDFFKAKKNAWSSDLKQCDLVVGPAEGDPLFNN